MSRLELAIGLGIVWVAGMAVFFLAGLVLSRRTLEVAARGPGALDTGDLSDGDRRLRRIYFVVLWISGAYLHLFFPALLALLLLGGGAILYSVAAVLVVISLLFWTSVAIGNKLVERGEGIDPGQHLDLGQHPRLREELAAVAAQVGTPPVDNVYTVAGASLGVLERSGLWRRMSGRRERCLIIGVHG